MSLLCKWLGHKWMPVRTYTKNKKGTRMIYLYRIACRRCKVGPFDEKELYEYERKN